MSEKACESIAEAFGEISDPRVTGRCEHKLLDILIIAICGVITGAESWVEIEPFGKLKEGKLRTFLDLAEGIPSHDTVGRVFGALNAEEFQKGFARWVEGVFQVSEWQAQIRQHTSNRVWTAKRANQTLQNPAEFDRLLGNIREHIEGTFHCIQNTGRNIERLLAKTIQGLCTRVILKVTCLVLKHLLRRNFGIDVQSFQVLSA